MFVRVTGENWHRLKSHVLEIERQSFLPSIQESERSLADVALSQSGIFLVALVADEAAAGYVMADELERFGDIPGTTSDPHYSRHDTIYVSSVAIHPRWRRRGLGVALEREVIAIAYNQGYVRVTAHIRSSARFDGQLSRRTLGTFANWYQTGVSFDYVVLNVKEVAARAHG
jgi:ribosomal protein S18 acetylase RimI-like enzyme